MKAVILAAGLGSRLGEHTIALPKGMIEFQGRSLIKWQMDSLNAAGIDEIIIVTGHCASCIKYPNVTYVHNPRYATTNMLESLMCAREHLSTGFILSYADIIYEKGLVEALLSSPSDVGVVADVEWRRYWEQRFGSAELDLESFSVDLQGEIKELGRPAASSSGITHRYVGLLKFSPNGSKTLQDVYDSRKQQGNKWPQSGKEFEQGYMTDILHQLIEHGQAVRVVETVNGWMEFDEPSDFSIANELWETGRLGLLGRFNPADVFEQKNVLNYEFAKFGADSVSTFKNERNTAACKLGVNYTSNGFDIQNINNHINTGRQAALLGWNGFFTGNVLQNALSALFLTQDDSKAIKDIDLLQQRFEATKVLFSAYCGDNLSNGFGSFQYADNYLYLAYAMAVRFHSTQCANFVNTLLKINDLLLSGLIQIQESQNLMLEVCLNCEADIIGNYYGIE